MGFTFSFSFSFPIPASASIPIPIPIPILIVDVESSIIVSHRVEVDGESLEDDGREASDSLV